MKTHPITYFTRFRFEKPTDAQNVPDDILPGVILCEEGEALGHGIYIDEKFLAAILSLVGKEPLKVRLDHPDKGGVGPVLSIVGEATNLRMSTVERDGNKIPALRGDIKLFNGSAKNDILTLAREASHHFGMSVDIELKGKRTSKGFEIFGERMKNGLIKAVPIAITAVDFVEEAAATRSLFSPAVDSKDFNDDMKLTKELLKKFGLPENATAEQINAKLESVQLAEEKEITQEDRIAKLRSHLEGDEEMLGHLNKVLAAYSDETEEEKAEKEKLAKEAAEKKMSKGFSEADLKLAVHKEVTNLMAKTGLKPRASAPNGDGGQGNVIKLSEERLSLAKKNNITEKVLLNAVKTVGELTPEEVELCENLGVDQDKYLVQLSLHPEIERLGK